MIRLVVFLGNCGKTYAKNRHNVAWLFANSLGLISGLEWHKKFNGEVIILDSYPQEKKYFLKPLTFMNLSGESAAPLAVFFKIKPEEILIVHDELELPPGTVSLKWAGGLGGHNGLRSLKAKLGTADFWRLRIGIGRPDKQTSMAHMDVASYVLSDFSSEEEILLSQIFPLLGVFFEQLMTENPTELLATWSKKKLNADVFQV